MLLKRIEGEIINIVGDKERVPISEYSSLIDLFEVDFKVQLSKDQNNQLDFIKKKLWNIKRAQLDYQWLLDRNVRARKYGETKLQLMSSLDLASIKAFCNGNLFLYDYVPEVREALQNKNANHLKTVNQLLAGSHRRGGNNLSDKLHLLSCFFYANENVRENLVFSTKDGRMLKNKLKVEKLPFSIIQPRDLESEIFS